MKKALLLATLMLTSCVQNIGGTPLHKIYADQIKKELNATEWCYTYQVAEPQKNDAYIITYYTFEPINSRSQWICTKVNNQIDCDLIKIEYI